MENKTMIELVADLKIVVNGQVQVRTNKLKPLVEAMELKAAEDMGTAEKGIQVEEIESDTKDSEEMTPEEIASENRYLKRKLTMYELKIGKREATIEEQEKEIKTYKKGVQATIFDV